MRVYVHRHNGCAYVLMFGAVGLLLTKLWPVLIGLAVLGVAYLVVSQVRHRKHDGFQASCGICRNTRKREYQQLQAQEQAAARDAHYAALKDRYRAG